MTALPASAAMSRDSARFSLLPCFCVIMQSSGSVRREALRTEDVDDAELATSRRTECARARKSLKGLDDEEEREGALRPLTDAVAGRGRAALFFVAFENTCDGVGVFTGVGLSAVVAGSAREDVVRPSLELLE